MGNYTLYDSQVTYGFGMIVRHNNELWIFDKQKFINKEVFQKSSINEEPEDDSEIWRKFDKCEMSPEEDGRIPGLKSYREDFDKKWNKKTLKSRTLSKIVLWKYLN